MKVEKHLKHNYQTEASTKKDEAMVAHIYAEWKKKGEKKV